MAERMALNAPIQGTAADIIKLSMVEVYNTLLVEYPSARLILQIHDEIIYEVQQALESGFDTIHFITDDIGSYGYDIGSNFGELYNKVCEVSPDFSIEISYCEPSEFMKYFDDIKGNITRITSMVYPIQSCNDRILALMNRKYTVKDFFESVKSIRAVHPNIYLINNIIY